MHRTMKLHLEMAERMPALAQMYIEMGEEELSVRSKIAKILGKLRLYCEREEAYSTLADAALVGHDCVSSEFKDMEMWILLPHLYEAMGDSWVKEWLYRWKSSSARSADYARQRLMNLGEIESKQDCPSCHGSGGMGTPWTCGSCGGRGEVAL